MTVKQLTKHNLEFLSLKGECTGSSESTLVKIPHCRKSHVAVDIIKLCLQMSDCRLQFSGHQASNNQCFYMMLADNNNMVE